VRRLVLLLLLACGPVDVVVADAPPLPPAPGCTGDVDCGAGLFCERARCDDSFGFCRPVPLECNEPAYDVCDCSKQHYSSDCARQQARQSPGPC
jgi:hypothetical protein